jgi:hypothetical protein
MSALLKKLNIQFNDVKNPRLLKTLNDLIEAAEKKVEEGNVDGFAARSLSKTSGHSLGSLIQRLGKIENIFLYAITLERSRHIKSIGMHLLKSMAFPRFGRQLILSTMSRGSVYEANQIHR